MRDRMSEIFWHPVTAASRAPRFLTTWPRNDGLWGREWEVICSPRAPLRMLDAKLQRVFFTFRTRGWHLQLFQKTWVVSTEFNLELNLLFLPYRQNFFCKSMKMLFIVKKKQTNKHFNLPFTAGQLVTAMMNGQHADPPSSILNRPKSKTGK